METKIIGWIKNEVKRTKAKGVVIGLSGGIDSSLVAALARKAVGKNKVLGIILPIHSSLEDLKDAQLVARKLGIAKKTIELTKIYDNLIQVLPRANTLAEMNLKPRLRMAVLYYFANKLNYLVCGTGNKSELSVGYFTKFGDGAADILPIADLFKWQVLKLAKALNIPEHIITKTPTAGLWPGQTDEGEMGIAYQELDDILSKLQTRQKQVFSKAKVNRVKEKITGSQHKREGPKICYVK